MYEDTNTNLSSNKEYNVCVFFYFILRPLYQYHT